MKAITKSTFAVVNIILICLLVFMPWHKWYVDSVDLAQAFQGISWLHLLGTDALGRDQFYRMILAVRISLPWLWSGVLLGSLIGLILVMIRIAFSESRGHHLSNKVWTSVDIFALVTTSLPVTVLCFLVVVYFEMFSIYTIALVIAAYVSFRNYNTVYHEFLVSNSQGHWQAHYALGGCIRDRVFKYGFLGEWKDLIIGNLLFHLKVAIIIEVSLSYLGFGIQEPQPSIGNIIASQMERYMSGDIFLLLAMIILIWSLCRFPSDINYLYKRLTLSKAGDYKIIKSN